MNTRTCDHIPDAGSTQTFLMRKATSCLSIKYMEMISLDGPNPEATHQRVQKGDPIGLVYPCCSINVVAAGLSGGRHVSGGIGTVFSSDPMNSRGLLWPMHGFLVSGIIRIIPDHCFLDLLGGKLQ